MLLSLFLTCKEKNSGIFQWLAPKTHGLAGFSDSADENGHRIWILEVKIHTIYIKTFFGCI